MATKPIHVSDDIHARVKATAAMQRTSIRAWVEGVLGDALDGQPSPSVLIDTKARYTTKEATE